MGWHVWGVVCLAIGLSSSGQPAIGEEPAPIKKLILPGETFLVRDRPAFIFWPPEAVRRQPQPWILYAPTLTGYPDAHARTVSGRWSGGRRH
jgi:hypothetical protein